MATIDTAKQEYNVNADAYDDLSLTRHGELETELVGSALGDCTGLTILDIGGGTGLRARQALEHGASLVDVVDLSSEMLQIGQGIKLSPQNHGRIRWHEGDCSKPLDHLPLQGKETYDVAMANWVFDHAGNIADLEGMWRNIRTYLKPGGRFIGVRCGDLHSPAILVDKYGVMFKDFEKIPGGFKFRYRVDTVPPIEIEGTSMETSYSGSTEMHEKFGFCEVETVSPAETEVVRKDPEFWKLFLDSPYMVMVKAKKKLD